MTIKPWSPVAALLLVGLVCACASDPGRPRGRGPGARGERDGRPPSADDGPGRPKAGGARLFISPAGEPFRPRPGAPDPMREWFEAADANHDGVLSPTEFLADHMRFFSQLDASGDGFIDGFEVTTYEETIAPEILGLNDRPGFADGGRTGQAEGPPRGGPGGGGRPGGGLGGRDGRGQQAEPETGGAAPRGADLEGAARFGLINEPEPIRAADADYDFRVSKAEWQAASARRFTLLDRNHDGKLTFDELRLLRGGDRKGRGRADSVGQRAGGAPPPSRLNKAPLSNTP